MLGYVMVKFYEQQKVVDIWVQTTFSVVWVISSLTCLKMYTCKIIDVYILDRITSAIFWVTWMCDQERYTGTG